jgi:hypothetical protein
MLFLPLVPLLLLAAASAHAAPAMRGGEAEVRAGVDGVPCFTISEREERRGEAPNFKGVTVIDPSNKARPVMWAMALPPERSFAVLHSMCVPYAGRVPALPQTAAATLEAGKVYEVSIEATSAAPGPGATTGAATSSTTNKKLRAGAGPHGGHSYRARFCLDRQDDGKLVVRQLGADPRASGACRAPAPRGKP